jgi:uncharacterized C2H2 Zn-finger protein
MMAQEDLKRLGIVSEVGLERDATEFTTYNLKVGIKLKAEKKLSYTEGERLIKLLKKELLGKNIELEAVAVPCPMCGKVFNSETGMKQHVRRQHDGQEEPPKKKRGRPKKATAKAPAKKAPAKKKKQASSKKK